MPKEEYVLAITLFHGPSGETFGAHREYFTPRDLAKLVLENRQVNEAHYGPILWPLIVNALGREPKDGNQ